jgi:hypothetical protein
MKQPYYVYAPEYNRMSAGIRVLHHLAHHLSLAGEDVYVASETHKDLKGTKITQQIFDHHMRVGFKPIVIYPETCTGNPVKAKNVVRYLLNYPGRLGGDKTYPKNEMVWAYSEELLHDQDEKFKNNVLDIPVVDRKIFYPPVGISHRSGICFYAEKVRLSNTEITHEKAQNCLEIYGKSCGRLAQTQEQIAEIFRRSEMFYTYEPTALSTEATLCGCPVTMMRSDYYSTNIGGMPPGHVWSGSWGKPRTDNAIAYYEKRLNSVPAQISKFIEETQKGAKDAVQK